jgi:hypothetical protein
MQQAIGLGYKHRLPVSVTPYMQMDVVFCAVLNFDHCNVSTSQAFYGNKMHRRIYKSPHVILS